jgi:hypothetical protein
VNASVHSREKDSKGYTSGWGIGRLWSWGLLSFSLKIHKIWFIRNRVILGSREGEILPQRGLSW